MTQELIRLLLVEDDPSDAELVCAALGESRRPRFEVARASRLSGALATLEAGGIDLVLLDLALPDSRGLTTCERLVAAHPDVPCIVLTGLDDDELGVRAVQGGAQDFVVKDRPVPEVLSRTVRHAIERHALASRLDQAAREARAGEQRFRSLIARSAEGILVVDGESTVRFANPAAEAILQRSVAELVGAPLSIPSAAGPAHEVLLPREDGSALSAEVRVAELEWEGGPARVVSIRDLTDRRRAERVALAEEVQRSFLPERMHARTGLLEVSATNDLCEDASGDFYDSVRFEDGRFVVAIGDVSGHGLGPALLMAQGRAYLRAYGRTVRDLARVFDLINEALAVDMAFGRFMTLVAVELDPDTGAGSWCNAGHVPALVLRAATGAVERLESSGVVLGVLPTARYAAGRGLSLGPGDVLLLCSDGATEATDAQGRPFGETRIAELLRAHAHQGTQVLLAAVRAALGAWTAGRPVQDDVTLLAVGRPGAIAAHATEPPPLEGAGKGPVRTLDADAGDPDLAAPLSREGGPS